jgi:predicted GNAT family N-acyltransferase
VKELHLKTCLFLEAFREIQDVRTQVFQREQGIAADLDFDGLDEQCVHLLAQVSGVAVGVARLRELDELQTIKLERLAILNAYRNQGLGSEMVCTAISYTQSLGYQRIKLHAQTATLEFYQRLGFKTVGEEFQEAGIAHIKMEQFL